MTVTPGSQVAMASSVPPRALLQGLQSARSRARINLIDRIRSYGIGDVVSLPQLAVCGDQSTGKSSVMEGITGIPFPRQEGCCTKFPTEIILRHSSQTESIHATIQPDLSRPLEAQANLRKYRRSLVDMSELPDVIKEVATLMQIRGYGDNIDGPGFAADVLRIEITAETDLNLTVVDLPGLISSTEDDNDKDIEIVAGMVDSYVSNSRAIILAVLQAGNDIANQGIVKVARRHDPQGQRTVGIITKPDLINEGSEVLIARIANNLDSFKLNLGFFLLKNPTPKQLELGITPAERSQAELEFFSSPPWVMQQLDMSRVGVENLKLFLQDLLDRHIEKELPKVRDEIKLHLHKTETSLGMLGDERPTTGHIRSFLTRLSMDFCHLMRAALDGNYHGVDFEFFNNVEDTRLRAVIHQANGQFADSMRKCGGKRVIGDVQCEDGEASHPLAVGENNEKQLNVTKSQMAAWVKETYMRTRGRELPGNYNYVLLAELFQEQSSRWPAIATDHVHRVMSIVTKWLRNATSRTVSEHGLEQEIHGLCLGRLESAERSALEELGKLIADEKRQPITYNHYYTDNIQNARHKSLTCTVERFVNEAVQNDYNGRLHVSNVPLDNQRFIGAVKGRIIVNMDDQACQEALAGLTSYYKVAKKTFVDNVCRQVIERHILGSLLEVFSPNTVSRFSDEELLRIGSEPEKQKTRRAELALRAESLRMSLNDLLRT